MSVRRLCGSNARSSRTTLSTCRLPFRGVTNFSTRSVKSCVGDFVACASCTIFTIRASLLSDARRVTLTSNNLLAAPDFYQHGFSNAAGWAAVRLGDGSMREVRSVDAERNEATFALAISSAAETLSTFVLLNVDAITTTRQEFIEGPLPAVPEPGSFALLLGSLGVVGLFAHWKSRPR